MEKTHLYAASALDRAAHLRGEAAWIAARLAHPKTRFLPVWRNRSLVLETDPPRAARFLPESLVQALLTRPDGTAAPLAFLGLFEEGAHFALDISHLDEPAPLAEKIGARFDDLRGLGPLLSPDDAGLLAYARGLLYWHRQHGHCGVCGARTESAEAGHMRRCTAEACGTEHFPRTDPAVITLVTSGKVCLLGRQKSWPEGMYSTLAGFVEPGESLEDTVVREVFEETGIHVTDVRYQSSQPWPFPASLMIGFRAQAAAGQTIAPMVDELEDVRWFSREELTDRKESGLRLPYRGAISRRLIEDWMETA